MKYEIYGELYQHIIVADILYTAEGLRKVVYYIIHTVLQCFKMKLNVRTLISILQTLF